ncbi:ATP-binding protein [Myxococcota bacterium]
MASSFSGPTVNDALDALVSQFSSALDCYRELVQNSIDAGSPRVDVWTEYVPGQAGKGTMAIHVDDFGEGMDEAIIDNELTQLFASSKEDDLTKIGKFGIGFVSIFALKPKAVLVHTGRGGEYWEILFAEDRTFTKVPIDDPVEGTQITLFVEGDRHSYNELVEGSHSALKRWCSHSETEVTFKDRSDPTLEKPETINEPFEVVGDVMTRVGHQGSEIVLAYSRRPVFSFHNKGLTLLRTSDREEALGGSGARFANIAFKIKSRYLEHTLSRETILKDQNYEKAVALLIEAADGPLFGGLIDELEELASRERFGVPAIERYMHLLSFLAEETEQNLLTVEDRKILRTVTGEAASLNEMRGSQGRDGWIFVGTERSKVTDMLHDQGTLVLLGRNPSHQDLSEQDESSWQAYRPMRAVVLRYLVARDRRSLVGRIEQKLSINLRQYDPLARFASQVAEPHDVYLAVQVDSRVPSQMRSLIRGAEAVLREVGAGYKRLVTCKLDAAVCDTPLFVVGRDVGPLMARPPRGVATDGARGRLVAAINREHPQYRALVDLFEERGHLAIYCLAKDLLLVEDRLLSLDMALMGAAMKQPAGPAPRKRLERD